MSEDEYFIPVTVKPDRNHVLIESISNREMIGIPNHRFVQRVLSSGERPLEVAYPSGLGSAAVATLGQYGDVIGSDRGGDVVTKEANGHTLLHEALYREFDKMVKILERGAPILEKIRFPWPLKEGMLPLWGDSTDLVLMLMLTILRAGQLYTSLLFGGGKMLCGFLPIPGSLDDLLKGY